MATDRDSSAWQAWGRQARRRLAAPDPAYLVLAIALASGLLVFLDSPLAFLSAIFDGLPALGIVLAAAGAGLWIVWGTGNGRLPIRWQLALGVGFGLGMLSLGVLWAGLCGLMSRTGWMAVMLALAVIGATAVYRGLRTWQTQPAGPRPELDAPGAAEPAGAWRWLWLLLVPAISLGILAASVPPGLLWAEEGNGYDVLEYHLGVPKEYYLNGQITYLDHNVYGNFPMNAEMLYLLTMVLRGDPWTAALTAQFVNLLLGALTAYVAWAIGRDYSPKVGILTGVAGATFGWLGFLSGVAYVENGMLFYGLLAAGLCARALRDPAERHWARALAVGALVGLACGYKYTAIPMIAAPLLGLWVLTSAADGKLSTGLIALVLAATAFAPWATKNQRMAGNPVFPLGHAVFGSRVWTQAEADKFAQGHAPLPAERPAAQRLVALGRRVLADPRFGYVPWLVAVLMAGAAFAGHGSHRRQALAWLTVLAIQMLVWLLATHLFARFAQVMWIPLVLLAAGGAAWALRAGRVARTAAVAALLVYVAGGQAWLWKEYRRHLHPAGQLLPVQGNTELFLLGRVPGFDHLAIINGQLPADARLLMVADARIYYVARRADYAVVFSRDPLAKAVERARGNPLAVIDWLRANQYTHVWVDFMEMGRLRGTYGFPAAVTTELFTQLEQAGLRRGHVVRFGQDGRPYGIIYEVPGA